MSKRKRCKTVAETAARIEELEEQVADLQARVAGLVATAQSHDTTLADLGPRLALLEGRQPTAVGV